MDVQPVLLARLEPLHIDHGVNLVAHLLERRLAESLVAFCRLQLGSRAHRFLGHRGAGAEQGAGNGSADDFSHGNPPARQSTRILSRSANAAARSPEGA
jgi:hypothetical protein